MIVRVNNGKILGSSCFALVIVDIVLLFGFHGLFVTLCYTSDGFTSLLFRRRFDMLHIVSCHLCIRPFIISKVYQSVNNVTYKALNTNVPI